MEKKTGRRCKELREKDWQGWKRRRGGRREEGGGVEKRKEQVSKKTVKTRIEMATGSQEEGTWISRVCLYTFLKISFCMQAYFSTGGKLFIDVRIIPIRRDMTSGVIAMNCTKIR